MTSPTARRDQPCQHAPSKLAVSRDGVVFGQLSGATPPRPAGPWRAARTLTTLTLALLLVLALAAPASAGGRGDDLEAVGPDTRQTMELAGFSKDGKKFVLKITDEEGRSLFEVRESRKGKHVASYPFFPEQDKAAWRKAKREHELDGAPSDGPENKDKGITLLSAVKGEALNVYAMSGETCTKLIDKIPLKKIEKGKNKGKVAEAFVKQLLWGPRGKFVVVVYHQKIEDTFPWEGDFAYSFKFKTYKAKCAPPAK
jgi:hypothetical protein